MSIRESDAAKRATLERGLRSAQVLMTAERDAPRADAERSPEAQMIKVEEKIGEKVLASGVATKFPARRAPSARPRN